MALSTAYKYGQIHGTVYYFDLIGDWQSFLSYMQTYMTKKHGLKMSGEYTEGFMSGLRGDKRVEYRFMKYPEKKEEISEVSP